MPLHCAASAAALLEPRRHVLLAEPCCCAAVLLSNSTRTPVLLSSGSLAAALTDLLRSQLTSRSGPTTMLLTFGTSSSDSSSELLEGISSGGGGGGGGMLTVLMLLLSSWLWLWPCCHERAASEPKVVLDVSRSTLRDNLNAQMLALKVTLPPETRPGVRVDQATARLAQAQELKVELEEKLFEVEAAVQDNLTKIAMATAELENAKRALIPSAPTTDPGSACITFSRESSLQNSIMDHGFLLACQTPSN